MGGFPPVYPPEDMEKLDENKRNELRLAIMKVLQTDPAVRKILKDKTYSEYERLVKKSD